MYNEFEEFNPYILPTKGGNYGGSSILYEVQEETGNEGNGNSDDEKRSQSPQGEMHRVRNRNVQNPGKID